LAIANFRLCGRLKQQLSGRTLGSEANMLETITEILTELPKDEMKRHSCIGQKDASGPQAIMEISIRISQTPSYFDIVSLDP
jgi:hypothetical protein